ncbi:unnamed protein product [Lactuca virosa]|uniref:Helicase C-terminal domain-containing protein n=1 Tax=Lactuca virosa TaxID=75947 RepID=A0AAU9P0K5_9ASTR|nr:unnamed protein product [Lactuca virosa]
MGSDTFHSHVSVFVSFIPPLPDSSSQLRPKKLSPPPPLTLSFLSIPPIGCFFYMIPVQFLRIDGTTKASDRLKIVDGIGAPIFLLTSQVGGLGLTLTKADRVIVVDPVWNPSTDRAYRIGQKKDKIVYRLMTCGTVEEKIYRKQMYKGGLFRSATEHKEQIRILGSFSVSQNRVLMFL